MNIMISIIRITFLLWVIFQMHHPFKHKIIRLIQACDIFNAHKLLKKFIKYGIIYICIILSLIPIAIHLFRNTVSIRYIVFRCQFYIVCIQFFLYLCFNLWIFFLGIFYIFSIILKILCMKIL